MIVLKLRKRCFNEFSRRQHKRELVMQSRTDDATAGKQNKNRKNKQANKHNETKQNKKSGVKFKDLRQIVGLLRHL